MFLEVNKNTPIPEVLPEEVQLVVKQLKEAGNQEACLQKVYEILTTRYRGYRIKTYTRPFDLFFRDVDDLWSRHGFLHCTNLNYLLRVFLVKSNFFQDANIKAHWTLVLGVSPHQYLSVKLKDGREIYVDMWSKAYGIKFGDYAHGFNSKLVAE